MIPSLENFRNRTPKHLYIIDNTDENVTQCHFYILSFPEQFIKLLAEGLLKVYTNAPCEKKFVITSQGKCPVQVHLGIKTLRHGMSTTHEEADVIIPQQVITTIEEGATCLKVVSDDTDVFVLLLHFYVQQSLSPTVFLKGTDSNRNVIDIGKQLGNKRCCNVFV